MPLYLQLSGVAGWKCFQNVGKCVFISEIEYFAFNFGGLYKSVYR